MALFTCPDCRKRISKSANACPNCGLPITSEVTAKIKKGKKAGSICRIVVYSILMIIILSFVVTVVSENQSTDKSSQSPKANKPIEKPVTKKEQLPKNFYVRIAYFNDTKEKPISNNCRMWIRGFGDFYPSRQKQWKFGGALIEKAGPFDTKDEHVIYFYPDYSDESREIKIPIKYSSGMNPNGSVRDMITIEIKPETIVFFGIPVKNANGQLTRTFNRKTCKEIIKTSELKQEKIQVVKSGVIGKWLEKSPYIGSNITILGKDGKLFMENKYKDGSVGKKEIVEMNSSKGKRFQDKKENSAGEFYLIDKQGNLQLWDDEGIIWTARKID